MIRKGDFNRIGSTKPMIHRVMSPFPKTAQEKNPKSDIKMSSQQKSIINRDHQKSGDWPSDHHDVAQQSGQGFVEKDDDDLGVFTPWKNDRTCDIPCFEKGVYRISSVGSKLHKRTIYHLNISKYNSKIQFHTGILIQRKIHLPQFFII